MDSVAASNMGGIQGADGRVITDPLAIQIAGHFLKTAIESGTYEHGREMYTLTVDESLGHLNAVLKEVGAPQDALIKTA